MDKPKGDARGSLLDSLKRLHAEGQIPFGSRLVIELPPREPRSNVLTFRPREPGRSTRC